MGWNFLDPATGASMALPIPAPGVTRDFTWMGIRKGGERWWNLFNNDGAWVIQAWRSPAPTGAGNPLYSTNLASPPGFGGFNPVGLTNNKQRLVVLARDISAATRDSMIYYDTQGNVVASHVLSDALDRRVLQGVFLEHDFYVLLEDGENPNRLHVYDSLGTFIRGFSPGPGTWRGITTDGKALYITDAVNSIGSKVRKIDAQGRAIRGYGLPTDGERYRWGITFNGRYLLTNSSPIT